MPANYSIKYVTKLFSLIKLSNNYSLILLPNTILIAGNALFSERVCKNYEIKWASQVALVGKEPACQCRRLRDQGSIPGSGRSPGGGHGNPLQYSGLENPTGGRACVPQSDMTEVTLPDALDKSTTNFYHSECTDLLPASFIQNSVSRKKTF